jgi:hypothetical protein
LSHGKHKQLDIDHPRQNPKPFPGERHHLPWNQQARQRRKRAQLPLRFSPADTLKARKRFRRFPLGRNRALCCLLIPAAKTRRVVIGASNAEEAIADAFKSFWVGWFV